MRGVIDSLRALFARPALVVAGEIIGLASLCLTAWLALVVGMAL